MILSERIAAVVEYSKLSIPKFAEYVGFKTPQTVRELIKGNTKTLSDSVQYRITSVYPEINRQWLMSGDGEMLTADTTDNEDEHENKSLDPIIERKAGRNRAHMIPFYDAETTGGFEGRVSSSNSEVSLRGYINAGDWFDGRETAAIRHCGDSMVEYPNGCVLAVREVREFRLLVPGRNYVIETDEYRVTKRVQKGSEKDCIALYSTNQEKYADGRLVYEPFEVYFQDIRRIFAVLGYIVNQSGEAQLVRT